MTPNSMTLLGLVFAPILTVISVLYIAVPRRSGLWLMCLAQILWAIEGYIIFHNGMLCQSLILLFINVISIISWKNKGIG